MKNISQSFVLACFLVLMALITTTLSGQVPESFNYQAILRDATGAVKSNTAVSLQIDILKGNPGGTNVFSEIHNVTTNSSGLIILQVGSLNTTDFADVNWSEGSYFLKVTADGMDMGTTQLLSVPYALHAKTVEVDQVDDADADPANELQTLDISGTMLTLSNGGGTVTLPSSGGGDNWGTQTAATDVTLTGNGTTATPLKLAQNGATSGQFLKWNGSAWAPGAGGDADADPTNELQTMSLSGTSLTLSNGGGTVTLPSSGGGDNWGTQTAATDATLTGNGTTATPLKLAQNGATSGQFLKWNGSSWAPGAGGDADADPANELQTLNLSGTSLSLSNGGGTVTLPSTADNWGTQTAATDATLTGNGTTATPLKIAQNGASAGQVLKWNGSAWVPGAGGIILPYSDTLLTSQVLLDITNDGFGNGLNVVVKNQSGARYAIQGKSAANNGRGIIGIASSLTGITYAVEGRAYSSMGRGVYGEAPFNGIEGNCTSNGGYGVLGRSEYEYGIGVKGIVLNPTSKAVVGQAPVYGVYGISTDIKGRSVVGKATNINSIGVYGTALEANSTGVWGEGALYDFCANGPGIDYHSTSSIRWKNNITAIANPLEMIQSMRGVYFNWDEAHGNRHDIGMIAEEVGKVLPEIVAFEENGVDASGLDYSKTTPLLLEGIKALMKELETLKKENEQLRAEDAKLRSLLEELLKKTEN